MWLISNLAQQQEKDYWCFDIRWQAESQIDSGGGYSLEKQVGASRCCFGYSEDKPQNFDLGKLPHSKLFFCTEPLQ